MPPRPSLAWQRIRPLLMALAVLGATLSARAAVIYSGLQDLQIPMNFDGIYLDIQTGVTSTSEFAGWDFNPFFGGVGVANSPDFQPARTGTGQMDPIRRFGVGASISGSLLFSDDYGGSDSHVGPGATQFGVGQEGYLAFRLITNGGLDFRYGWVRVVFAPDAEQAVISDWAYEDSGSPIVAGRVRESPVAAGVRVTTFSPGAGESFGYGSVIADRGGAASALTKTGAGTTILTASQSFTGATTITGGVLELGTGGMLAGTSGIAVNGGGTLLYSGAGGTNTRAHTAAAVALGGGVLSAAGLTSTLDQTFGALTLSQTSTIDFGLLAAGHALRFDASAGAAWGSGQTLRVFNYTSGVDRLFFGSGNSGLTTSQLAAVQFYSDNGVTLLSAGPAVFLGGSGEIAPIPEPGGVVVALTLCALAWWREERCSRRGSRPRALRQVA